MPTAKKKTQNHKIKGAVILVGIAIFAGMSFGLGGVVYAADPVLTACNKALPDNIQKKACSAKYINDTKSMATKVCQAAITGPPSPACMQTHAIKYIQDAAKATSSPKTVAKFQSALNQVLKNATPPPSSPPAQTAPATEECTAENCDLVHRYINPFINLLAGLMGLVAVVSLIMGGIQYTTAGGDPQKVAKAKKRIAMTVVALICFFFLYGFLQFLIPGGIFKQS